MDCYSCQTNAQRDSLPPRELIAVDEHWRVAHALGTGLPGWTVLVARRHVETMAELTDAEAASLGLWQIRVSRALHETLGCAKTYMAQFSEAEGFHHLHVHVVPRMVDIPDDHRGPRVFQYLHPEPGAQVEDTASDALALGLRTHLDLPISNAITQALIHTSALSRPGPVPMRSEDLAVQRPWLAVGRDPSSRPAGWRTNREADTRIDHHHETADSDTTPNQPTKKPVDPPAKACQGGAGIWRPEGRRTP